MFFDARSPVENAEAVKNFARKAGRNKVSDEEARMRRLQEQETIRNDLQHEIIVAKLNSELALFKKTGEAEPKKSKEEMLAESLSDHDAHVITAKKLARLKKEENQQKFANDPEFLERANEAVDNWLEKQL